MRNRLISVNNMRFQKLPTPQSTLNHSPTDCSANAKSLAICSLPEARQRLDYEHASRLCVLPLGFSGRENMRVLQVAIPIKSELSLKSQIKFAANSEIECTEVDQLTLSKAIEIAYRADDQWLQNGLSPLKDSLGSKFEIHEEDLLIENASNPVPYALRTLIEYSIAKDASDIHLIPMRDGLAVKLRVNGEILTHQQSICSLEVGSRLISRIKILASLRIDERFLPQDGSFTINLNSGRRQLRVSTLATIHGEKCVLRITSNSSIRNLENLGFSCNLLNNIKDLTNNCSGLVLISGATGSGKSTTLYAIAQQLLNKNLNIASVEDPVESYLDGISQTSLAPERGLDYPSALRAILRQDPDVILVGEIRDLESAKLVVSAALTGHLVLSTVHGANLFESITRITQMGIDTDTLSRVLKLIINQSLVQRLCSKCKILDLLAAQQHAARVFKAVGCASCDYSGFDGRLLIAESMFFNKQEALIKFMQLTSEELLDLNAYESKVLYLENYLRSGLIVVDEFLKKKKG